MKRVTFRILPRKSEAEDHTPRGLGEIKHTIADRIAKGSTVVSDGWSSTVSALRELGYKHPPPVVHEDGYRDLKTGFHTNDAESENSRLKGKNRKRYGKLLLNENELAEYTFYINIGSTMPKVLEGLAMSSGGVVKNALIA